MHIVINAFSARRGGGKTYLRNLLLYCPNDDGLKVTVLVASSSKLEVTHPNIQIYRVKFPVDNPLLRVFWEKTRLSQFLRRVKADILFCPGGVLPIASTDQWKTVTMFRNMIPFDEEQRKKYPFGYMRLRNFLLSKILLRSMESADLVIFISEYAKSIIHRISEKGIKKSVTIPHGVGKDFFRSNLEGSKAFNFLPQTPYILYPSIIDVYKSQLEVVQAVSNLVDRDIDVPVLLMVGEVYGKYGDKVRALINNKGLHDKVILTGGVPYTEMPYLYQHAEFVIFASQSENCPNILLEALASGCAILCSDRMPMPEFGDDSVEYFDPDNPEQLSYGIEKFIFNKKYLLKKQQVALERAKIFSWEKSANLTWQALFAC
ncbi:MAG: glycosyltransferase family 4 protein [Desulfobulbaceae bacterium]|nr:glycosyltransferase family 4 protein [Desulfobulbaceae bacterium]